MMGLLHSLQWAVQSGVLRGISMRVVTMLYLAMRAQTVQYKETRIHSTVNTVGRAIGMCLVQLIHSSFYIRFSNHWPPATSHCFIIDTLCWRDFYGIRRTDPWKRRSGIDEELYPLAHHVAHVSVRRVAGISGGSGGLLRQEQWPEPGFGLGWVCVVIVRRHA